MYCFHFIFVYGVLSDVADLGQGVGLDRTSTPSAIALLYICAGMQDSETLFLKATRLL
ncbi:hypothetical protein QUA27_17350 [Microcoleus sp. Pol14C6]|uniref:hypothetical protein n=1 Tax=unclassified Microcoleus TaxID=2642155 RepID=UPI002FD4896F